MSSPCARARRSCFALTLLALLGLAAVGCERERHSGPSVGGNTNWLLKCDDDATCGAAGSCICGRCSRTCATEQDCSTVPDATCTPGFASDLQCNASAAPRVCLFACASDDDCEADTACVNGACIERSRPIACDDHADALFCSGFEDSGLPEWIVLGVPNSTLEPSAEPRHSGAFALEAQALVRNGRSRLEGQFARQDTGTIHLRAWLFVEPDAVLDNVHVITLGDVDTPDWGVTFDLYRGELAIETPITAPVGEGVSIPRGRWFCLQAEIELSDSAGAVRVTLDGQPVVDAQSLDTLPAAGAHSLAVGIDHLAQDQPARVFFDDVLVDDVPTRCGQ